MRVYPVQDNGLYLQEHSADTLNNISNDGLYLKQNNMIENGEKLYLLRTAHFIILQF